MATSRKNSKTKQVDQPKWMGILVSLAFGVMLTLIGLVFLVGIVQVKVLNCTRLEPSQYTCVLEWKLLGIWPLSSTPLRLSGARLAQEISESTSQDDEGRTRTSKSTLYWVILITEGGEVALDTGRSSWIGSKQQTVERINAFVRSRAASSLQVYGDWTSLLFVWAPLLPLVFGLLLLRGTVKDIGAKFTLFRNVHKPMARPR